MVDRMSYLGDKDFLVEVQKGNVAGHSMVHKFGRNDSIPNGSWAHVSQTPFAVANFRTSASTVRVKAGGDAADTSGGAGARTVKVQGIDSAFAETTETITLAGALASSATTASFWRIHRAWVDTTGAYGGTSTANIVVEDSGGAADLITIIAGEGQSQYAGFTIPTGKTGYLLSVHLAVDSNKTADFRMFTRQNIDTVSAPFIPKRLKKYWDGIEGSLLYRPRAPEAAGLSGKTDIWFEAFGDGAASEVSVDFELILVDD
jgi:hypothetical protein